MMHQTAFFFLMCSLIAVNSISCYVLYTLECAVFFFRMDTYKTRRGAGVGDWRIKPGDWEMGDIITCFVPLDFCHVQY